MLRPTVSIAYYYFSISGEECDRHMNSDDLNPILKMDFATLKDYFMILWSGNLDDTRMELHTCSEGRMVKQVVFHG